MNQQTNSDLVSGEIQHTATPWALNRNEIPPLIYAPLGNGQGEPCIALLDGDERCWAFPDVLTQTANAEFIVRAVNAHDDLVKTLQAAHAAAHAVLIAGGDYGDDLSERDLRDLLKKSQATICAALAKAGVK